MTKKKSNRLKHQQDVSFADTSDEELNLSIQGKSCQHVTRGIHFGRVKKALKSPQSILTCGGCSSETTEEELPEVWLCLQCGYRGCGRNSENKHALQHFKTIHSDCHSLVLNTSSSAVWCYDCDDAVSLQSSRILKQCVEYVMKMAPSALNKADFSKVNKVGAQQSLQISIIKEETSVHTSEESEPAENIKKPAKNVKDSPQKVSIKGLRNLGNTCFFNAVMQNLNQTSLLYHELKNTCTPSHSWEVPELVFTENEVSRSENTENLKLSLPRQLPLTTSLFNFFELVNTKSTMKVDIVNPSPLFGEISKKCPQFRHFQEQDSHELLRQLLDNVRQEEIKRQKKAILKFFELENVSPENVDEDMKRRCKAYGCYASHTIIERVFGGLLISTVLCGECKMSSQIFEPFMDLSLPLFEEKQQESIELNGMLDGGKQDQKPLRNRKSDIDEDNHGEYVLPKPKSEPGKPSKHQEKKQKQLTKKEKKRSRNARNRKPSLSEIGDSSVNAQPTNSPVANEDETNQDSADEESAENDQNDDNQKETESAKVCVESPAEDQQQQSLADSKKAENGEDCSIVAYNHENPENTLPSTHSEHEQCLEAADQVTENTVNHEDIELHFEDFSVSCHLETVMEEVGKESCHETKDEIKAEVKGMTEVGVTPMPLVTKGIKIELNSDKDNLLEMSTENAEESVFASEHGDVIHDLTKDFRNCLISEESNKTNLEDRIQALSMQIKDVRIRRDSDRQEMLLNSSDSADENASQRTNCTSPKSSIEDSCSNENGDNWSHSVSEQQTKEWILKSLTTLKPRHNASPMECSIQSCLSHFTKPELLTGNNKFRCENCTEMKIKKTGNKKDVAYSNASKQILIFSPPAVLTLHLKRFQQVGMSLRKVNRFVEFPVILDLAPFCSSACVILPHMSSVEDEILYSLYGIVEHSGRLTSGHYTAYVKVSKRTINTLFECQVPLGQCNLEQLLHKYSGSDRSSYGVCSDISAEEKRQWFYISDSHVKEVSEAQVLKCQAYLLFYERIK